MSVWRVGSKIPVNLYKDDAIAGQCQSPELAAQIANGMNAGPALLGRILQLEQRSQDLAYGFRNTVAMLNAAIRIVRQLGGPEQDVLLWAEQVKSGMALVSGAPDYAHAQFVVDLEQRNKALYEDAMVAHKWFVEQFGEVMNGRDFAVKCPMATERLAGSWGRLAEALAALVHVETWWLVQGHVHPAPACILQVRELLAKHRAEKAGESGKADEPVV